MLVWFQENEAAKHSTLILRCQLVEGLWMCLHHNIILNNMLDRKMEIKVLFFCVCAILVEIYKMFKIYINQK